MIALALPLHGGNVASAIKAARAGKLRRVHLHALTVDVLTTLEFVSAVEVVGDKHALDILRARHRIIFASGGERS